MRRSNTMLKKLPIFLLTPIFAFAFVVPVALVPAISYAAPTGDTSASTTNSTGDTSASTQGDCGGALCNPLKNISSLDGLLSAVLNAIVTVLAPIFLTLAFIYVGFLFVMAQGNAEKISGAKTALIWTVIGALILLGANAIGLVIKSTVGGL